MEKHINKIAIAILKEEYSDYPENDWHYNREYRMLVKAQNRVKKLNIDDVSGSDLIAKADQYLKEAKYKIENFNEYDDDFGRGSYFGVKRIVDLIKRHYR